MEAQRADRLLQLGRFAQAVLYATLAIFPLAVGGLTNMGRASLPSHLAHTMMMGSLWAALVVVGSYKAYSYAEESWGTPSAVASSILACMVGLWSWSFFTGDTPAQASFLAVQAAFLVPMVVFATWVTRGILRFYSEVRHGSED